jgi:DNA-binding LacI/PurR family transcriptional regulator
MKGAMTSTTPARLQDVARAAGVHASTVSRVLNGADGRVSQATRQRIHDTAELLRYRPNPLARGLKTSTTGALGLLVPSLRNPVFAEFIRGAFHRAFERDFVVLLAEDRGDGSSQAAYQRLVESGRIDGLLVASGHISTAMTRRLTERQVPHVFVNRRFPGSGRNVYMDEATAGRLGAEHLLGLEHTHFGHIAGPVGLETSQRRTMGFTKMLVKSGLEPTVARAPYEEAAAFDAVTDLLGSHSELTAIFLSNINQAIGALAALRQLGRSCPDNLSLVACDDDPLVDFLEVPLTTIRMPLWELGVAAIDALLSQIDGNPQGDVLVESRPILVERSSTSRPRRNG